MIHRYLHTILATTVDGQLSRYQVTKSALLFLSENSENFSDEIGQNGYVWFSYMSFCCTSETKTVGAPMSMIFWRHDRLTKNVYVCRLKNMLLLAPTAF